MSNYNVFISYKAYDGKIPTRDMEIAEKLYQSLSACDGVLPFWDQKELEQVGGRSDFSSSIYSALDSARIYIFICTRAEYLYSSYIESEWSTYLTELNSGRKPRGSIFGITENIEYKDLPLGLRKYETLPYSDENIQVITKFVKNQLRADGSSAQSTQQWIQQRREELHSRLVIADVNARQFLDEFLAQEEMQASCLVFDNEFKNDTVLLAEAIRLSQNYELCFFDSLDEALLIVQSDEAYFRNFEAEQLLVFVDSPLTSKDAKAFQQLSSLLPCKIVIRAHGQTPSFCSGSTFLTHLSPPDEHELMATVKTICREVNLSKPNQFIYQLSSPANKALQKPTYIRMMIEYLLQYGDSILDSPGLPLFALMDSAIAEMDPEAGTIIDQIVDSYLKKKSLFISASMFSGNPQLIRLMERASLIEQKAGMVSFTLSDYLMYKAAQIIILENGQGSIQFLRECGLLKLIPLTAYLMSEQFEMELSDQLTNELADAQKQSLLSLYLDSDHFPQAAACVADEKMVAETLLQHVDKGYSEVVQKVIRQLENADPSISERDWMRVLHMAVDSYMDGSFHDCHVEDSVYYWFYKGDIHYCLDEYELSISSFEKAIELCSNDEMLGKIILKYSDVLTDGGYPERLNSLLEQNQHILTQMNNRVHYSIYRGNLSLNQGELLDAKAYYMEALSKLQKHFNAAEMARVYGNLGLTDYYLGDLASARRHFLINEDISIDSDNTNGIAISRVYLGQTYLLEQAYDRAFNYFSSALFYASKAQNQWRITQISILLDQFYPGFTERVDKHIQAINRIRSLSYHSDMYLMLAECMMRVGSPKKQICAVFDQCIEVSKSGSRLNGSIAASYCRFLDHADGLTDIPYLSAYYR